MSGYVGYRKVPTQANASGIWGLNDQAKANKDLIWPYRPPYIGGQGGQGFGVGSYPMPLPSGFSALTGHEDKASDNYGNYQTTNGSIMVFVPRFYYRIGNANSPRYATYGLNAIDIVGMDTYATEALANAAGYAMHRAFKDGGADKIGFFVDKYIASKDGTTTCKSVFGGVPISLTTDTNYTRSNGMSGCTGICADSVALALARGTGFQVTSIFQNNALALLSLAHAQASTGTTYCAWYDANGTTNFPKGCTGNNLKDANDDTVTYATAGDAGAAGKPKTGAITNFAKTTHNGQACGVADLNGSMWETLLGITAPGSTETDTTQITNGDVYVLKPSVALSSLTGGFGSGTAAWGGATHLAGLYDSVSGLLPWGSTTDWTRFGNGTNQVFAEDLIGTDWIRTGAGIQQDNNAVSGDANSGGTALFGNDGVYRYNTANVFPIGGASWGSGGIAGVFARYWVNSRSASSLAVGFRCGFYANS